jgi:acyl CoA:acetate/3-ketoacid CoA transferase
VKRNKVISAEAAARVIVNGDTVATGGFVGIGVPEELLIALCLYRPTVPELGPRSTFGEISPRDATGARGRK